MKIDLPKVINFTSNKDNNGSKGNAVNLKDKKLFSENIQNDEDFIPFMPFLPVDNLSLEEKEVNIEYTESFQSLQFLTSSMQQLLQSNILIFLRNVFHNPEFLLFIQSYLSHRTKPIFSRVDASKEVSNSLLFKLDRMVFQCYYRVLSQDHEYKTISQYLPKTKVMIVLPSDNLENDNEANSTPVDTEALFPQYRKLVTNLEILKFPYLLDFIGIMGQSNIPLLSKEIIQNLLYWREESFQTEMLLSFKEIHVTLRQLVQNIHQFYQKFVNYYENQKNISKKKLQAIQQQQLQQQQNALFSKIKDEKYELLLQFYDFYLFIKDILYSLYLFFQIIDVQWIRLSPFYCCLGESLSPEYGLLMIECLEIFIEIFVSYIDLIQELHTRSYVTSLLQFSLFQDKIQEVLGQFQDTKLFIEEYAFQIMKQLFSFANYSIPNKPNNSSENNSNAPGGGLRRLNSRKISDPILAKTSSWTEGKPSSSSPPSYQIWKEILKKKLDLSFFILDQSTPPLLIQRNGTFFMHFFKNSEMLKSFISFYCILGGKKDEIEGIMENFQKMSMTATLPPPPPPAASSTAAPTASSKPTASSLPPPSKEMIANIQSIFPDLGDGFIESCLIFYKNNSEELIDALLMDNLAPALSSLDRRMMKVSLGKNTLLEGQTLASKPTAIPILPPPMSSPTSSIASTSTAGGAGRKGQTQKNEISSEVIFQPTNQFQSLQRQVLSTIEQKQKYDAYIVDTMIMYDDDYDDQYDESIAWKGHPTSRPIRAYSEEYDDEDEDGPPPVAVEPVGKKGGNNKQQKEAEKVDWDKQMKETKRYNDMIKEEAKEILFWKEMENTNRNQKGVRGGKDAWKYEDEEEQGEQPAEGKAENLKTSADTSKQLPQGPGGRGGTGGGGGGGGRGQGRGEGGRGGRGGGKGSGGGGGGNKNESKPQSASQDSADSTNPNSQQKKSHKPHFDKHHQKDKALRKTGGFF